MKKKLLMTAPLLLMGWAAIKVAPRSVVPAEVLRKAQTEGAVRIIVQLDVTTQPEGYLANSQARLAQRQSIAAAQRALLADLVGTNHSVARQFQTIPFLALKVAPDALALLERWPRVVGVVEDKLVGPALQESVPLVEGDQAWDAGFDGTGWEIVIVDTGVDKDHPFLSGKVVDEACFSSAGSCPDGGTSEHGPGTAAPCTFAPFGCIHGTHVAGIAAGLGGYSQDVNFSGVAKGANLIAIQVYQPSTQCLPFEENPCVRASVSDIAAAFEYVLLLKVTHPQIASVNFSSGGGDHFTSRASCDENNPLFKFAIDSLRSVGVAVVAASGNDAIIDGSFIEGIASPACISTAVSVGATTKQDLVGEDFSQSACVLSLLAPGVDINSSIPGGEFQPLTGTSMAAPHVAGAWAILKQTLSSASVSEVTNALQSTGLPITDSRNQLTKPRIRIFQALQALGNPNRPYVTLDGPPTIGLGTYANAINECGQVVGYYNRFDPQRGWHGFKWYPGGEVTTIDFPDAGNTWITGINNAGTMVGYWWTDQPPTGTQGFRYFADGGYESIEPLMACVGDSFEPFGINDKGSFVGSFSDAVSGRTRGFVWDNGVCTAIEPEGVDIFATGARGINNAGQIVGSYNTLPEFVQYSFLRSTGGDSTPINVPGARGTTASGINDVGEIVGSYRDDVMAVHGFLRSPGGSYTTIDLPDAGNFTSPAGVSNSGQIVGAFNNRDGIHGFVSGSTLR